MRKPSCYVAAHAARQPDQEVDRINQSMARQLLQRASNSLLLRDADGCCRNGPGAARQKLGGAQWHSKALIRPSLAAIRLRW